MKQPKVDNGIFWSALVIIAILSVPVLIDPERGNAMLGNVLNFITGKFGTLYLWGAAVAFGILVWLAFGKYGNVKFGDSDTKPEFSNMSWIAMLFTAGIGSGLMYWGTIEWAYYYTAPPFGVQPKSVEAADWAATYGLFHWGFTAWAIYCIPSLPVAYALYKKKQQSLRLSTVCRGVKPDSLLAKAIDVIFMFGLIGGVGTSLGLATPLISEGVSQLIGIPKGLALDVGIIVVWTLMFGGSVYFGLNKGLKILSDINVYLFIAIAAFIIIFGPTAFILSRFTDSVGLLLQNFVRMSFYTDSVGGSGFAESWTIFYWAWWVAYAPFMGMFVARISKGRTIRELVVAECFWGTLGCWLSFALLGNSGMYFELNKIVPVIDILNQSGAPAAILAVIKGLPLGDVIMPLFVILTMLFLATTLDSSAYTLASVASKDLHPDAEPARWHRVFWAVVLGAVAIIMFYGGGLKALQTLSIITAFPLLFVLGLMTVSFLKTLKEDHELAVNQTNSQYEIREESKAKIG
jgi:BCCT family betaine/carnitine transporter